VWNLRALGLSFPPALLAMTAAYAANTTLTILVVRTHSPWRSGSVVGVIVVVTQLGAMVALYPRWRRAG
jgi:hypothetical protein